jgi:hypothetical protein
LDALSARTMRLLAGWAVRDITAARLPTDPQSPVEFVKINRTCEHQEPGCYEFLTSPHAAGEQPGSRLVWQPSVSLAR